MLAESHAKEARQAADFSSHPINWWHELTWACKINNTCWRWWQIRKCTKTQWLLLGLLNCQRSASCLLLVVVRFWGLRNSSPIKNNNTNQGNWDKTDRCQPKQVVVGKLLALKPFGHLTFVSNVQVCMVVMCFMITRASGSPQNHRDHQELRRVPSWAISCTYS